MAVIGKVGTFAQVQPVQGPDFGGMVKAEFDKLDAERKAKAAAKAKAKKEEQDRIARLGGLGDLKTTNINGFNKGLYDAYSQMKDEYVEAERNGDYFTARRLKDSLDTLNNSTQMAINKMSFNEKEADNLDPDFYQRNNNVLRSINDGNTDIKYNGNGQMLLTVYEDPEKTKVIFENMSPNEIVSKLDAPYKFSLEGTVNEFTDNYKPSSIESLMKDKISTVKVSDVMNDPNVLNGINNKATELANDANSLAWYGKTFLNKYETDKNNFSEKEKEEAKEYFRTRILDSYEDKIDLSIQQRRGGGGSKGSDAPKPGTPVLYEAGAITLKEAEPSGSTTVTPTENQSFTVSLTNSKGNPLVVSSMPLDRILYDKKTGRMYVSLSASYGAGEGMGRDGQSLSERVTVKEPGWYGQQSDVFNRLVSGLNSSLGWDLKTAEDLRKRLFGDERL